VRTKVEGSPGRYSGRDALTGAVLRAGQAARGGVGALTKTAVVVFLAGAAVFGYLYATMEREGAYEERIVLERDRIQALEGELARLNEDMADLEHRVRELGYGGDSRANKVRIMELSVELNEMARKAVELQDGMEHHHRSIREAKALLEELRGKDFMDRLLKK
jgi:hypothetical protein